MFGLKLNISGTSTYTFFLGLFSEKKSTTGMKSWTQFLKKKQRVLYVFESFLKAKINLGICKIMQSIYTYFAVCLWYIRKADSYGISCRKKG